MNKKENNKSKKQIKNRYHFTSGVEKLVDPISVGTLHFMQSFSGMLPISQQNKIVEKSSANNPLMGFVVEPYCYFMFYEISDEEYFEKHLPENFELERVKIFKNDKQAKKYLIIGSFNARTSGFMGCRSEAYVSAKNKKTGLTSWVIIDYLTNTISYDTKNGLTAPGNSQSFVTTNFAGEIIANLKSNEKELNFIADLKNYEVLELDEKLWIEGNLSVAYGKNLSTTGDLFSLRFDPEEMTKAWQMPLESIKISKNNWFNQYVETKPSKLVCFPYAQHFISDAPGFKSAITNEEELVDSIEKIEFAKIAVYSSEGFKKAIIFVPTILLLITIILVILLINH